MIKNTSSSEIFALIEDKLSKIKYHHGFRASVGNTESLLFIENTNQELVDLLQEYLSTTTKECNAANELSRKIKMEQYLKLKEELGIEC